jgi:hypothetical protein
MTFKEQLNKMHDFYIDTEKRFIDLIRIIPLDNDPKTYSPILYDILQSTCSQAENLMRLICDKIELKYYGNHFPDYYKPLNSNGMLEIQEVILMKTNTSYKPFNIGSGENVPFWWTGYNSTKHRLPDGFKDGNIVNTTNALASVYLLHCIANYANYYRKLIDKRNWYSVQPIYDASGGFVKVRMNLPDSDVFATLFVYNEQVGQTDEPMVDTEKLSRDVL